MTGRPPKPTHLKLVSGNPGKRPINKKEPRVARSRPSAPAHLSDRAKETWGYASAVLDRLGVLTEPDAMALELLCEAYADFLSAKSTLAEFGSNYYETVAITGGRLHRLHPAVGVMQDADRRIKTWLTEFGMTPSSRSRVHVLDVDTKTDPAAQYLA